MTDPGTADRTYIGPMTPELVEQILDKVGFPNILLCCLLKSCLLGRRLVLIMETSRLCCYLFVFCPAVQERPDAILPTMGGQTALNLAKALSEVCTPFAAV